MTAAGAATYEMPPQSIAKLVDAPVTPSFTLDPTRAWALIVEQPALPPIEEIAREERKLGGIRFDPSMWTPSNLSFGLSISFRRILDGDTPVALGSDQDIAICGLPKEAGVRWIKWRPSGGAVAFVVRPEKDTEQLELWYAEFDMNAPGKGQRCVARPLVQDRTLQSVLGAPHSWTADDRLLVKLVPLNHGEPPAKPLRPVGPATQANFGKKKPARTYQDLLKNAHDVAQFQYYLTSELVVVQPRALKLDFLMVGPKEGCLLRSAQPSPDSSSVLCTVIKQDEVSFLVPYRRFGHTLEVWKLPPTGAVATIVSAPRKLIADVPLQESVPISHDARVLGPRSMTWHPCCPATLIWVAAVDGGDPKNEPRKDGYRDMLFTQPASSDAPTELFGFEKRWSGWWFTEDGVGLMRERRWKDRSEVAWRLDKDGSRVKLWERMYQDRYGDPGSPEEDYNGMHQLVLQKASSASPNAGDDVPCIYFMGNGASPRGDRPFVDARPLAPAGAESNGCPPATRIWRCPPGPTKATDAAENPEAEVDGKLLPEEGRRPIFESPIYILGTNDQLLLLRQESNSTPPNYLIRNLQTGEDTALTNHAHPQPELAATTSEIINYKRKDGIELNAKLYLPAGYDPARDGPRPCLMWAYPGEFKDAKAAGQVKESPYRFTRAHWSRPLIWLAEGWVVLERFAMPILGEGDCEPNDTFVEQVVSNAEAACEEVIRRGVTSRGKIAVGGHSYGAFMTAHLLAHSDLFAAGLARSGAYNRTLTPMGFQAEERDYWHAMETYHKLSPFTYALQLAEKGAPLLLIHGDNDNNSGTHPMQSERMYQAVSGQGGVVKLCILPHESHGYKARESIMHTLAEQHAWLTRWVVDGEVSPAAQKRKEQEAAKASEERNIFLLASAAAALPLAVLVALRLK